MPIKRQHEADEDAPRLAIRRHTDRCFHMVEEVVPEGPIGDRPAGTPGVTPTKRGGNNPGDIPGAGFRGVRGYIVDGVMIDADDVAEVREVPDSDSGGGCNSGGGGGPDCLGTNESRQG